MEQKTTCAIIGGGPAGMVLGLLLARAGVQVTVLEKHGDFLRDFRGDTVHPSTLRLLDELGLWDRFSQLPFSEVRQAKLDFGGRSATLVDFERLSWLPHRFIAMVPQWDLLDLLADAARAEPSFTLRMNTEVTGLLTDTRGAVTGVRYQGPDGVGELSAELTVACDGRWSIARTGLKTREYPVPFDVWWFRLPHTGPAEFSVVPRTARGKAAILIPRPGYFQVAYLGAKGSDAAVRDRGLQAFRDEVRVVIPDADLSALQSMDDVKCLDVRVDRLRRWHTDGLLCIGDAAHAMSPVGGVGINLAVQDAVAAARLLAEPLRTHRVSGRDLAAVRRRRAPAAAATQAVQRILHRVLLGPILRGAEFQPPAALFTLMRRLPWLSAVPAYFVGVGVRPEHAPEFARR